MAHPQKTLSKKQASNQQKQGLTVTKTPAYLNKIHPMLQLQQKLGNRAVNHFIQTKLTMGEPGDKYEQEADQVAASVMRTATPTLQPQEHEDEEIQTKQITPIVQTQKVEEEEEPSLSMLQKQPEEEKEETVQMLQRQPEEEEETIQMKSVSGQTAQVSSNIETRIQSRRGGGKGLSPATRAFMEPRFGYDFSRVRVHTDSHAAKATHELNAQAFTTGQDIFFGSGYYEPHTRKGKSLLAHELTHTIQQQPAKAQRLVQRRNGMDGGSMGTPVATPAPVSTPVASPAPVSAPVASPAPTPVATPAPVSAPVSSPAPTPVPVSTPTTETQPPEIAPEATTRAAPIREMGGGSTESVPTETAPESTAPESMGEPSAAPVPLLMPEPPSDLSPEAQSRLEQAQSNAAEVASTESELPDAEASVTSARGAVAEPPEESNARAGEALVEALGERPQPSPEIEDLCQRIREVIRSKRPPDEESLVDADPTAAAEQAGGQLNQSIENETERLEGSYESLNQEPQGTPEQEPQAIEVPPETVPTPEVGAEGAVPDPVPSEAVSLDADVAATQSQMQDAGMNSEAAQLVETGPIAEARQAQGELEETAARDPAVVLVQQQEALNSASADMAALEASALNALSTDRVSTVSNVHGQQTDMVGSEEQMRSQIGTQAQTIFSQAQQDVNTLLTPLSQTAMNKWEQGVAVLSEKFKQHLSRVEGWIEERHEDWAAAAWDYLAGLPDWVTDEYDEAEEAFGDGVCKLIREISTEVNGVIATCEAIIDQARQDINNLFTNLPAELQEWATSERERFNAQLDGLQQQVMDTRDNFNRDLTNRAAQAVQDVRQQIHQLRQAAGGLIGRVADAVNRFLEDPAKFIIEGLLALVGIPPSAFWAVVNRIGQVINDIADDPLGFAENLLAAIGQGFAQFFGKITDYLLSGLLEWLFSGLGSVGVQVPSDFSLSSIITFFLQLMGITWERIRGLLARHIGEENVALIEQAYELIANLIAMGPQGIFDMIKEQLNPQTILDQVLQAAVDFLVETLMQQVSVRILALFNPVGAIVQAIEAIYKVLKWIFENAARLFSFVETIVNGMADIIAGNVSGMANAVETALARLLAPVIDFFAGFIGLGNLPDRIADTIRGFQEWVESIIERVIAWLAERARALLRSLGIGGAEGGTTTAGAVGEVIPFPTDDESHELFFETEGRQAILVVKSRKKTVVDWIAHWKGKVGDIADPDAQSQANKLIGDLENSLGTIQTNASQILTQRAAGDASTTRNQPQVRTQGSNLAQLQRNLIDSYLRQLFELFGEDAAPRRTADRFERAQSIDTFYSEFQADDWQSQFSISRATAYRDIDWGLDYNKLDKPRHGRYLLKQLSRDDLIQLAKEVLLGKGPQQIGLNNTKFGYQEIKAFLVAADRVPNQSDIYTPELINEIVSKLIGKGLIEAGANEYTWAVEDVEWRQLPTSWKGEDVRYKYYIQGSGFTTKANQIRRDGVNEVKNMIADLESGNPQLIRRGQGRWRIYAAQKIVPDPEYIPSQKSQYEQEGNYDVDHTKPLAWHWEFEAGYNSTWQERKEIAAGNNLQLMWGALNRAKGSKGPDGREGRYTNKFEVGRRFTSPWTESKGFMYADSTTKFANFAHL
ncbi:MAG: DUF4157 domain-containing protein [Crocosphaera sp.]